MLNDNEVDARQEDREEETGLEVWGRPCTADRTCASSPLSFMVGCVDCTFSMPPSPSILKHTTATFSNMLTQCFLLFVFSFLDRLANVAVQWTNLKKRKWKTTFNNPHIRKPGWRWKWAGRASLEDRPSLLVTGGCWLMRRKVTGRIPSLLAVRLPWPHRTLAQAIGRWPQAASGACPGHTGAHPRYLFTLRWLGALPIAMAGRIPRPHRELSRYLCKLRDWAQAQSYAAGLPALCHKW